MAVVVTGAAGFIGRHLVAALHQRGHVVTGVDRRAAIPPAATALVGDLTGADVRIDDALRDADAVFHLAAFPGVRDSGPAAERRRRVDNVDATRRVLAATPLDVPVIVTSSSSVYGGSTGRPSKETDALRPRGSYASSKLEVERLCAQRASRGGLVAVGRPFTVAGEGQRPDMAIARWIGAARAGEPLTIIGGMSRSRDITDVDDVVRGLIAIAERGVRTTVNLGTGVGHRLGDVVAAVERAVGATVSTGTIPAGEHEPPATLADTARCRSLLGFVPSTDLDDLVRRQALAGTPVAAAL